MSSLFRRQEFSPSCPSGGTWYACETGSKFVGCCNSSPCVNGCPDGNLCPASFDPEFYGKFKDQECPKGSRWYSCAYTSPPFLGCCKSPACGTGCPVGDLTAGFLSSNPYIAEGYLSSLTSSASSSDKPTSTSRSTSATSATVIGSSSKPSAAAEPIATSSSTKISTGAIAGGAVGGLAVIAILVILLLLYRKRRASTSSEHICELDAPREKPTPMYKDGGSSESSTQDSKHGASQCRQAIVSLLTAHILTCQSPTNRIFHTCADLSTFVASSGLPFIASRRDGWTIRTQTALITICKLAEHVYTLDKRTRYHHFRTNPTWRLGQLQRIQS